jgi:PST family polysaccharide transporter
MNSLLKKIFASTEYKNLFTNILHLFFFQGTNYLLPLITIPYIVRIIGPQKFGLLSFAEAINYYFVLISDYGFNITGTQKLALKRGNLQDRNRIFSVIFSVKMILLFLCLTFLLLFDQIVGLGSDSRVYYLYFLMVPGNILLSYWFYLGMEKMHYLNFPNLLSRITYAILVFIFLRNADQYYLVPLFYGLSLIGGGLLSIFLVFSKFKYSWTNPTLWEIRDYLKSGWSIFISTFAINLYRKSNVFILGLVASKEAVGFYSAGEKIIIALQSLFNPVIQAFYPFFSRKKKESVEVALLDMKILLISLGSATGTLAILIIIFATQITEIVLGESFSASSTVIRIGTMVIFLSVINYILGIIFMTNFNFEKHFSRRVIITGLTNLLICWILSNLWQEIGAAIAFLFAEVFLMFLLVFFIWHKKNSWKPASEI